MTGMLKKTEENMSKIEKRWRTVKENYNLEQRMQFWKF